MCKVHKFSETTNSNTYSYVFKSFGSKTPEKDSVSLEVSSECLKNIEILEQKIQILQKEADTIINKAEAEAKKIIENANRSAVDILNTSSIQGYKKGLSLANEKTEEIIRTTNLKVVNIIESARANTDKIIGGLEDEILSFSLDIAKKILDIELERNDKVFVKVIKKALNKIKSDTDAKIIMQTDDLQRFENTEFNKPINDGKQANLIFAADGNMNKGDIIIETEKGSVDAGINSQFTRIKSALMKEKLSVV